MAPQEVLRRLRSSAVEALLLPDGTLLNDPTEDWYVPITPVHAQPELLVDAYVSASLWQPPTWDWSAGELKSVLYSTKAARRRPRLLGFGHAPDKAPGDLLSFDTQRPKRGYGARAILADSYTDGVVDLLSIVKGVVGGTRAILRKPRQPGPSSRPEAVVQPR